MDVNSVIISYNGREIVTDETEEENLRDNLIIDKESESALLSDEYFVVNHSITEDFVSHASRSSYLASTTPKNPIFNNHASSRKASAAFEVDGSSHLDRVSQTVSSAESANAPITATNLSNKMIRCYQLNQSCSKPRATYLLLENSQRCHYTHSSLPS